MANDMNLLYFCDPSKNTECRKTGCYENGGPCRHTTHAEYADTTGYAFPATQGTEWAQIVRCKDCKHRVKDEEGGLLDGDGLLYCDLDSWDPWERNRNANDDDWFCADGKPKE